MPDRIVIASQNVHAARVTLDDGYFESQVWCILLRVSSRCSALRLIVKLILSRNSKQMPVPVDEFFDGHRLAPGDPFDDIVAPAKSPSLCSIATSSSC